MKSIEQVLAESTCQKRKTVCELYDEAGDLLARESNRCNPVGGICHRLGVVQNKDNYDTSSNCGWTHCEINALRHIPEGSRPYRAVLFGHDFYCDNCEQDLRTAGVEIFEVNKPIHYAT